MRLSVNTATVPSVTEASAAAIDTSGATAGATAAVAALTSDSSVPPPSVNVTRTRTGLPCSAAPGV